MKNYQGMTQEELEKELAGIVRRNYEKGIIVLDQNYEIDIYMAIRKLSDMEDVGAMVEILRVIKCKPELRKYCDGMVDSENIIQPVSSKRAWKEKTYEDFVSREEFMNRTGIFVTPEGFSSMYETDWEDAKSKGISVDEFVDNYEKLTCNVLDIRLHGTFKYLADDVSLSGDGEYDDYHELNIYEIMNSLACTYEHERQ